MPTETESTGALRVEVMERLFTDLQVERFNQLYYQKRAKRVKRLITLANAIAALSASGALIGLLTTGPGVLPTLWKVLVGIAAISAAVSPLLELDTKFSRLEQAALGHTIAKDRLWQLLRDLKISEIEETHKAREAEIGAFRDALGALDEDPHDSVRRSCWEEVEREFPAEKAWTIL